MAYVCAKCSYTTDIKAVYEKHLSRKIPCVVEERVHSFSCDRCTDTFLTDNYLQIHLKKCTGVASLQCPTCHGRFKDRSTKSRHIKKGTCTEAMRPITGNSVNNVGNNNTINLGTTINNNNVTINCTPTQKDEIVSFMDTDLDAVVALILKDPARFQLALQSGTLHQELCKATHFGDIEKNKNILGIQEKGTNMRVIQDGKKLAMCKTQGINRIMYNNHRIATDDKTAEYFGATPIRRNDRVRQALSRVVQNKGDYVPVNNVPRDGPKAIAPDKMTDDDITDFENALLAYWQLSEYDLIVPFGVKSFQHSLLYEGSRWWRSANREGGWAICDNGKEAVSDSVMQLLDTVRSRLEAALKVEGVTKAEVWHCKDVQEALDYLRPIEFINLVYSNAVM